MPSNRGRSFRRPGVRDRTVGGTGDGTEPQGTDPKVIFGSDLLAWWRSDMLITLNGTTVSAWGDASGNGHTLSQGVALMQPLYSLSDAGFGGAPSLSFDGINDILAVGAGFVFGVHTAFLVCTGISDSSNNYFFYMPQDAGNYTYCWASNSYSTAVSRGGTLDGKNDGASWGQWGASTVKTLRVEFDGTHAGHKLALNNVYESLADATSADPGTGTTSGPLYLFGDNGATFAQVKVVEFVIAGVVDTGKSAATETYLRSRYGHY